MPFALAPDHPPVLITPLLVGQAALARIDLQALARATPLPERWEGEVVLRDGRRLQVPGRCQLRERGGWLELVASEPPPAALLRGGRLELRVG